MQSSFIKAETYPVSGFLKTGRGCVVISSDVITDVYLLLIAHNRIFTKIITILAALIIIVIIIIIITFRYLILNQFL